MRALTWVRPPVHRLGTAAAGEVSMAPHVLVPAAAATLVGDDRAEATAEPL